MKYEKINIPIYDWTLFFYELESSSDAETFIKHIKKEKGHNSELASTVYEEVSNGCYDGGWASIEGAKSKSWIILYPMSSDKSRRKILNHEKRHIEDQLLEHFSINDSESAAMLAGYIGEKIYKFL